MVAGLSRNEMKSLGYGTALVLANIALMSLLSFTPAANLLGFLAGINGFLVMIVYGALLTGGNALAETGIERYNTTTAAIGVFLLQFAYGTFGAGLLKNLSLEFQAIALGLTAVVTTLIALVAGIIVYRSDRNFSKWRWYSFGLFIAALVTGGIGVFFPPLLLLTFVLILAAFTALLVYEIWQMKARHQHPLLNGVGLYVAYMGVFIQILQIILRLLSKADE